MATVDQVMRAVRAENAELLSRHLAAPRRATEEQWRAVLGPALIEATRKKSVACVEALLAGGADPNAKDHLEQSALHWACFHGAAECAERLILAGAQTEVTIRNGVTRPLHAALRSWSAPTVEALLNGGAKALDPDGSCSARVQASQQMEIAKTKRDPKLGAFAQAALALLERAELLELSASAPKSKAVSL